VCAASSRDRLPATFAGRWRESVERRGDAPFLVFEGPGQIVHRFTYDGFDHVVGGVADWLADRGVVAGSAVHLALTNSPTFVAVWLAAARLGAWIVPSDPGATAPELVDHLDRTRPAVGVCATDRADIYRIAVDDADVPDLTVLEVDEADARFAWVPTPSNVGPIADPEPLARAAVMFTSGTTGRPKGVEITQANYAFAGDTMAAAADLGPDDAYLVVLPLFHANAQFYSFAAAISVGASVALMHTFSASGFVEQAARHGATHASLFAGPMRMILARGGPPEDPGAMRLRHCWFAQNLADDQYDTLTEWLGCRPRQLYGMTETLPAVLTDSAIDPRGDTMGSVTPGCAVDLQDADGRTCGPDEVGEIVVGGVPGLTIFAGYLDDPATTEGSFRTGPDGNRWFLTGDRARRDADGRYRFDGRRSDVLKVSGENVSTVEVEAVISAHPDVFDVAVVGMPDPVRDEVPIAFVVPAPEAPDTLDVELVAWCAQRLSKAKRPRSFTIVDELPRTSVGKIRKFVLRGEDG
jgi:crotonobetaine/carnitine-CoA ligase